MPSWHRHAPLYSQRLVALELVPQSEDDSIVEVMSRRATVSQYVYEAVSSVGPWHRDWNGRDSRPVLGTNDATKNVGSGLRDYSGVRRATE